MHRHELTRNAYIQGITEEPIKEKILQPSIQVMYYKGWFNLESPTPDMVDVRDVALGLSRQARYNGFTNGFYSVAEHSILLAAWLMKEKKNPELAMLGLLHDASEAYIGDLVTPIKVFMPQYGIWEARIQEACVSALMPKKSKWFGRLAHTDRAMVKQGDQRIRIDETNKLMHQGAKNNWAINNAQELTNSREPLGVYIEPLDPGRAEIQWFNAYTMYLGALTHGVPS